MTCLTTPSIRYREFLRVYGGRVPPAAGGTARGTTHHNAGGGAIGGGGTRGVTSVGASAVSEHVSRRREPSKPEGIDKKLSSPLAQVNLFLVSINSQWLTSDLALTSL